MFHFSNIDSDNRISQKSGGANPEDQIGRMAILQVLVPPPLYLRIYSNAQRMRWCNAFPVLDKPLLLSAESENPFLNPY